MVFEYADRQDSEGWLEVEEVTADALVFREGNADGPAAATLKRADVERLRAALDAWLRASTNPTP